MTHFCCFSLLSYHNYYSEVVAKENNILCLCFLSCKVIIFIYEF